MKPNTQVYAVSLSRAATVAALLVSISPAVHAQEPTVPTPAAPVVPAPQASPLPVQTQPSAPTPPTPLPSKTPDVNTVGVPNRNVEQTTRFDFKNNKTPGQPQEGDPTTITTLEQALQIAYQRSPTVLLAQERAVKTQSTVAQLLGGQGPQVSGALTYSRLLNSQSGFGGSSSTGGSSSQNPFAVGLQNTPPGSQPVTLSSGSTVSTSGAVTTTRAAATTRQEADPDPDPTTPTTGNSFSSSSADPNQIAARITVTQAIDITGILRTTKQLGDLEKALTRLELARVRQETALTVKNSYYSVLRAAAFVKVNEASVADSTELLRVTEAQQKAGVSSAFDVLRSRTQLDNNRQALIQSRNQLLIAKNSFANTLGVDPSTTVELTDTPEIPALPELDETALLTKAFAQRPEYFQSDVNIMKATKNVRFSRRTMEPSLNASLTGAYNVTQPAVGSNRDTGSVGLTLGIPLWDGGSTREAVKAARSDERYALIQKDQFVRGIKAEVQQAIIAVRDASERQTTTAATVDQAREALRLANVRYKAGVGTQLEINDAQTSLTQAETNQVNAQYDYLAALARLSRAVGNPE